MKKILNAFIAAATAVMAGASLMTGAFADYTYSLDDDRLVDDVVADSVEINGTEATLTKNLGTSDEDDGITVRFALFNEYLEADYWNNPDVRVSVDVKLETEGADVIGYIPGFDNKWKWVNPSEFTVLPYGEWITVTETGEHFYEGFKDNGPNRFCFQVRSNWGAPAAGEVTLSVKNFTISDSAGSVVIDPESGDVSDSESSGGSIADSEVTDDSSVISDDPSSAATSMVIADAPDEEISYTPVQPDAGKESAMVIIIVVVIAAVIVAGAVVGYIIYKKRKYY